MTKTSSRASSQTSVAGTLTSPARRAQLAVDAEVGTVRSAAIPVSPFLISLLMLVSGTSALVYQVAWTRELQLVFGGSTAASGAVLSIFMAGLGLGNFVFGRRADRVERPLLLYGALEVAIAASVALSPWVVDAIRAVYAGVGGQTSLGLTAATILRLCLSCLVMLLPTMLMGGTLPAAVRAATNARDTSRRSMALLYGFNTLGAVVGTGLSTFVLLELWGTRTTLWAACLLNLAAGIAAMIKGRKTEVLTAVESDQSPDGRPGQRFAERAKKRSASAVDSAPARFIYLAAGVVGFAFFLMEIVWFRMLSPLLGGTTFAFGLILGVALSGIGVGGLLWAAVANRIRPTLTLFAISCALEALLMAVPFALGDQIALHAAEFRVGQVDSFGPLVAHWAGIAMLVVFPSAVVSGMQFPLLVSLLGQGRNRIAREVGQAFACNTLGALLGSLLGGFGLVPLLSANGAWMASVLLLSTLGCVAAGLAFRQRQLVLPTAGALGLAAAAIACLAATGPTAVWRHGGIGAARVASPGSSPNERIDWLNSIRRRFIYEADGVEASIAIESTNGYAFYVNGKSDGNAIGDAGTQIMLGVLPAWLHDDPQSALVVGLGTGESAGWLAEVPTIRRVDVVELEPAIDEMARLCAPVNFDVLNHPKVRRIYNDAREVLVTTAEMYDLIVSEPSNPYRAGIANLFTQEFYRAVDRRLNDGGLFVQWLQAYEVDEQTMRTVLATLGSVFGHVEVWQSKPEDLLLVCSREPPARSETSLRQRLANHPFRDAAAKAWRVVDLEGMLSRYVAGSETVHRFAGRDATINLDDRNVIEYGFARTLGRHTNAHSLALRDLAVSIGDARPNISGVDWNRVNDHRQLFLSVLLGKPTLPPQPTRAQSERHVLLERYSRAEMQKVVEMWRTSQREPIFPGELSLIAIACAETSDRATLSLLKRLTEFNQPEADAIRAFYFARNEDWKKAAEALEDALIGLRTDPWAFSHAVELVFPIALSIRAKEPDQAYRIWQALDQPFVANAYDLQRRVCRLQLSTSAGPEAVLKSIESFEPHPIWDETFLESRARAYRLANHPLAQRAAADLDRFRQNKSVKRK